MEVCQRPERHMAQAHSNGAWRRIRRRAMTRLRWFCRSDNDEAIEVTHEAKQGPVSNNHELAHEIPLEELNHMNWFPQKKAIFAQI